MMFYLVLFAVVGLFSLLCVIPGVFLAIWKRKWIEAEGVILKCRVKHSRGEHNRLVIDYHVDYEFKVEGLRYFGTDTVRLETRADYEAEGKLDELRQEYATGTFLKIYYAPSVPQANSARREVVGLYKLIFIGTVGAFLAIVVYYLNQAMEMSTRH